MMLVFAAGQGSLWADAVTVARLSSLCAELSSSRPFTRCLAQLPALGVERSRCLGFLQSLRRATGTRAVVLLPGASLAARDLEACATQGVDEAIIRQGREPAGGALDAVRRFQSRGGGHSLPLRVWLDPSDDAERFRTAMQWTRLLGSGADVGPTPVAIDAVPHEGSGESPSRAALSDGEPLACEWIRRALTVHPSGSLVPCAVHGAEAAVSLENTPAHLAAQVKLWPETLGGSTTCRRCRRGMRFTLPIWMQDAPPAPRAASSVHPVFQDHVGDRLDRLDETQREALVTAFVGRLRGEPAEGRGDEANA